MELSQKESSRSSKVKSVSLEESSSVSVSSKRNDKALKKQLEMKNDLITQF